MHLTDIFVRRPVLAIVISLVILVLGARGYMELNIRQYPESSSTVITVTTPYVGASADVVRGFVTTPLEQVIASADGIDYIESSSRSNFSSIQIHLVLNYPPNEAVAQILTKINRVRNTLPEGSESPNLSVRTGGDEQFLYIGFSSGVLSAPKITDYLTRVVRPQIETLPGVQSAQILGGRTFAMRIWLKPDRMAALGLTASDVRSAIERNNFRSAIGDTQNRLMTVALDAETGLMSAAEFRRMVVRSQGSTVVRLEDVANVSLGSETYDISVRRNGEPATAIAVDVVPTANPLSVISDVKKLLPGIRDQLPEGLEAEVIYDATLFISQSIYEVLESLIMAIAIVVVVIFLALGTVRSAFIPALAVPLAMIGAGAVMYAFGFTINTLTLLALVLAIGVIVDDAIVVVEVVYRRMQEGAKPLEAARLAARELLGPVIAMNVVVVAVFIPVALQGGLTGNLFREFAFTVMTAAVLSGVVGLTLSPMLAGRLLRENEMEGWYSSRVDRFFERLAEGYVALLKPALGVRWLLIALGLAAFGANYWLVTVAQKELVPQEDQGFLLASATADPNVSIDRLEEMTGRFDSAIGDLEPVAGYFVINGAAPGGIGATQNQAFSGTILHRWKDRDQSQQQVQSQMQARLSRIGGLETVVFAPPPLPGVGGGLPVQFVVGSTEDSRRIYEVAERLLARARDSGLFAVVRSDLNYDRKQVGVRIDRDRAADLGVDMRRLAADLSTLLAGERVNFFSMRGRSYEVIPSARESERRLPEQLLNYRTRTREGDLVPVSTVVALEERVVPRQLKRFEQLNAAIISGVPAPGVTLDEAVGFLDQTANEIFPAGFRSEYGGLTRQFIEQSGTLLPVFALSIVLIYLVLAAQYESFRDPLIMLVTVPMSTFGALLFIVIAGASINIYTQIGLMALIGTVSKHGILMVEYAREQQAKEGLNRYEAIQVAAKTRLRPILMTTAATAFGLIPLLLATGPGAASRFAIGLVPSAGMVVGTMFTLFILPAFYTVIASERSDSVAPKRDEPESATVLQKHGAVED